MPAMMVNVLVGCWLGAVGSREFGVSLSFVLVWGSQEPPGVPTSYGNMTHRLAEDLDPKAVQKPTVGAAARSRATASTRAARSS